MLLQIESFVTIILCLINRNEPDPILNPTLPQIFPEKYVLRSLGRQGRENSENDFPGIIRWTLAHFPGPVFDPSIRGAAKISPRIGPVRQKTDPDKKLAVPFLTPNQPQAYLLLLF